MAARAYQFHGPTIRAQREKLGVSGVEFAEKVGISGTHLSQIERGGKQPSAAVGRRIANELGVPLEAVASNVGDGAA